MGNCHDSHSRSCIAEKIVTATSFGDKGSNFAPVDLAVSELPASRDWMMAGQALYHTSIMLSGKEYWFGKEGLQCIPARDRFSVPPSHNGKMQSVVHEAGFTRRSGDELVKALRSFFRPDNYDLLMLNCNTFTDVALAYLLSRRLPKKYSVSEKLGQDLPSVVSIVTEGKYEPNPKAKQFDVESVVMRVDPNAWMGTSRALTT
mmetsp:Transcript_68039/g.107922  ORF Transcript_68039/g.107922 Transcript_68039/m.107922 type:complete len:203 (-) Transcript_68039:83-691(-)